MNQWCPPRWIAFDNCPSRIQNLVVEVPPDRDGFTNIFLAI
jgi:hypothetical protein